jgi:hypothetical protein
MSEAVDTRLMYEVLKDVEACLVRLDSMRDEMREGFTSSRGRLTTQQADVAALERRMVELERGMERVMRTLELVDKPASPRKDALLPAPA